jgi:cold shock CspA family protein
MAKHSGVVRWISKLAGYGLVRCNGSDQESVPFSLVGPEGDEFLCNGEPVLFDLVQQGASVRAENVKRMIEDLDAYQNFGGLYS